MTDRRRTQRIRISDHLECRIGAVGTAQIVDISIEGALVEIRESMEPDIAYHFSMPVDGGDEIDVDARVQRCQTSRYIENGLGCSSFMYRAALEFIEMDLMTQSKLERYLDRIKKRSKAPDTARIAQLTRDIH